MAGPPAAVAAARRAVARVSLPAGTQVVAGVSGGADSLALAVALAYVAPRAGWVARAIVVDHGLRPASHDDAAVAAAQCRQLGLDAEVVRVAVERGNRGPEAHAREARLAALLEAAGPTGVVMLAHTLNDQAETVLLGLARGSGTRSLAGMAPRHGQLVRPFLELTRAQTEEVCTAAGLIPFRDPTNELDGPWRRADGGPLLRAAARHAVLPVMERELGPGVAAALARTARLAREDADALDEVAQQEWEAVAVSDRDGQVTLLVSRLAALPAAVRSRVLKQAIIVSGGAATAAHVWEVDCLLMDYHGQGPVPYPGGAVQREGQTLVFSKRSGDGRQ